MFKKLYDKSPVLYGILYGQGLFIFFILLEYFLVSTGISECGVIVDTVIRIVFGIFALMLMKNIYQNEFREKFLVKIPAGAWLFCIPFFIYMGLQILYLPIAKRVTAAYTSAFLLNCMEQLATGFFEEATSKGLVMSGMLLKWKNTVKGRIFTVFASGVLFGTLHLLNVLFTGNIVECMWNSLYASAFGILMAAIYLNTENVVLCMVLHAVWDIFIRIPGYFAENINVGSVFGYIQTAQDIVELCIFPIVAILICIKWKPVSKE